MHRKLCRFWLNYRCPGKRSIPSVAPMLMALQQGCCLSVGVRQIRGQGSEGHHSREREMLAQSIIISGGGKGGI